MGCVRRTSRGCVELTDFLVFDELFDFLVCGTDELIEVLAHNALVKCVLTMTHNKHDAEWVQLNARFLLFVEEGCLLGVC